MFDLFSWILYAYSNYRFHDLFIIFFFFAVPDYVVGQSEAEASKEGRTLADFYYGCLGYSVYMTDKDSSTAMKQQAKTQLPVCLGLEV